jgi:PIN domain nuclease of toxin-antitoxin system
VAGSEQLRGSDVRGVIESAAASSRLFLSSISLWETAMLVSKRRITLSIDTTDWIRIGLQGAGIQTVDISPEIAVESANPGNSFHGDPADRIIVATARVCDYSLVTRDARILAYSHEGFCRTLRV